MVYGTDNGVYLANLLAKEKSPVKVIAVANVTQVDVLEEYGILIVLAGMFGDSFAMLLSFVPDIQPPYRQSRSDIPRG